MAINTPIGTINTSYSTPTPAVATAPVAPATTGVVQNNAISSQNVQAQNGTVAAPTAAPVAPTGGQAVAAPNTTIAYSFLDGSGYNSAGQQVKPPTVVSAKAATDDLAKKQADLSMANNAMATQATNVANNTANANAPQPATVDDINKILTPADKTNSDLQDTQDKADAAYKIFQDQIAQIQSGTFPLTTDQQAQVNSLQQQFQQLRQAQDLADQNYTGGITNAGIAAGRNRYAPELDLGLIQASVSAGIQKIATIDAQAATAISQLKQGFLDNDYKLINAAYTAASEAFKAKSTTIQNMADNVRQQTQDALEKHKSDMADQKQEQDRSDAAIKFAVDNGVTKQFYLVGNTAIDSKTGLPVSLAEYQKATGQQAGTPENQTDFSHIQTLASPEVKALKDKYPDAGILPTDTAEQARAKLSNSAIYHKETYIAPPAGSGGSGGVTTGVNSQGQSVTIPDLVAPYYNVSHSGVGYVDATTLQGTAAEKSNIVNLAQKAGFKVITNKNTAADLVNIADANSKLDTIGGIMATLTPVSATARDLGGLLGNKVASALQTNAQKAAVGTLQSVGLDMLKALSGIQGFRGNASVVQQINDHLPTIYDTKDVAQQKIDYMRQLISDREDAIVGKSTNNSGSSDGNPQQYNLNGKILNLQPDGTYK